MREITCIRKEDESIKKKKSITLEFVGGQKERKTDTNLEKHRFERTTKMWQITE